MADFPLNGDMDNAIDVPDFLDWLHELNAAATQYPGGEVHSVLTIDGGSITPTKAFHRIAGQGGTDDSLTYINPVNIRDGGRIALLKANSSETITVEQNTSGGNIRLANGQSCELGMLHEELLLRRSGGIFYEVARRAFETPYFTKSIQTINSDTTYTIPDGVRQAVFTIYPAGGGGGGGAGTNTDGTIVVGSAGGQGGTTTVTGAGFANISEAGALGGSGAGIFSGGGTGGLNATDGARGFLSVAGQGGRATRFHTSGLGQGGNGGAGAGRDPSQTSAHSGGGGGGGSSAAPIRVVKTVIPGQVLTITRGAGGSAGAGGVGTYATGTAGSAGTAGAVVIEFS
jgi:hypothetical protein